MIKTVYEMIKTLQSCYSADDKIFVVWVAQDEPTMNEEPTAAQWNAILKHLDKHSDVAYLLESDLQQAHSKVVQD